MKFIGQSANILTDGDLVCTYNDILSIFEKIKRYFEKKDINYNDTIALECENSLTTAIIFLYLLENGHSVLVIPKDIKSNQNALLPVFCKFRFSTDSIEDKEDSMLFDPEQWLNIFYNERFQSDNKMACVREKLYLKTSGSTGVPKLVVLSHSALQGVSVNCAKRLELKSDDRIAIPVPISHSYGLKSAFLAGAAVQASIDLQKGVNLLKYIKREREFQPNVAFITPIFCETLIQCRNLPRTYKMTVAAGDCFRGDTFSKYESMFGCLVNLYGSTETCPVASGSPNDSAKVRSRTVGKPLDNIQIKINEKDQTGEIYCSTPYIFDGYTDDYGHTIERGQDYADGWFRMKDLGRICSDSYIEIIGRSDHSVNRDGLLVTYGEVEAALKSIQGIEAAVIVSKGESVHGKRLIAYCFPAKDSKITTNDIKSKCFDILPKHAIPDKFIILYNVLLLPNGKIDRIALTNMVED